MQSSSIKTTYLQYHNGAETPDPFITLSPPQKLKKRHGNSTTDAPQAPTPHQESYKNTEATNLLDERIASTLNAIFETHQHCKNIGNGILISII